MKNLWSEKSSFNLFLKSVFKERTPKTTVRKANISVTKYNASSKSNTIFNVDEQNEIYKCVGLLNVVFHKVIKFTELGSSHD